MTAGEEGFLLLTGYLGDPERKPLTVAQFRELTVRARAMSRPNADRDLTEEDLLAIGCDKTAARRILQLLSQEEQLQWYVSRGNREGCQPITRISEGYPHRLRTALAMEAPGTLWHKGDLSLLHRKTVSLVGSRDLFPENEAFAKEVGRQAALQGYVLVSGNARGADRIAQDSCLAHGGSVISVVADRLTDHREKANVLYLSEDGYDLEFSAYRALKRNRVIHSLSDQTFVAQCTLEKGGTWDGTKNNLRHGWSHVFCFRDGSRSVRELEQMGATGIDQEALADFSALQPKAMNFIDQ